MTLQSVIVNIDVPDVAAGIAFYCWRLARLGDPFGPGICLIAFSGDAAAGVST